MDGFDGMTQARGSYYKARGVSLAGLLLALVYGAVGAALFGLAYGYLVQYNPFVYVNFIASVGFGSIVGGITWFGARHGKLRTPTVAGLVGAITGAGGVYAGWVAWLRALVGRADESYWVVDPGALFEMAKLINISGAWSLRSWTPTGGFLWAIWGLEALLIIGASAMMAHTLAETTPFCERCSAWAEEVFSGQKLGPAADREALRAALEAGRVQPLEALGAATAGEHTQVELHVCPNCRQVGFLNVTGVGIKVDTKGKEEEEKKQFIQNLILDESGVEVARRLESVAPAAAAAE